MRTIKATVNISGDHKLVLELPHDIAPGKHRVIVMLEEALPEARPETETPVRWDEGVLVYDGEIAGPIDTVLDDLREERMRHILGGHEQ